MFCLPPQFADKLKTAIKSGKISPDKLNTMESVERRNYLADIIGVDNAKEVNLLFEKKLLLKDQERAMYDWAREVTGLSKVEKEELSAKIKETYAEKKRRVFSPSENEVFLGELASFTYSKRYKTDIAIDEAQEITELAQDFKVKRDKVDEKMVDGKWESEQDRLKYGIDFGASKVALDNYVGHLKLEANKRPLVNILKEEGLKGKALGMIENAKISFNFIADNSRAIVAGFFDNSFFGRQGRQAITRPATAKAWMRNFGKSFMDMYSVLKYGPRTGDAIKDGIKAEIYSRENFLNGRYERGKKLDIGTGEEEFPTSLPGEIPYLGRLFKSSEVAYEGGAMRLRADIADGFYKMAEKQGKDLNDKEEIKAINDIINIMTGRGSLGSYENVGKELNKVFFSAKFAKSQIDKLSRPLLAKTSFAKKQAAYNLLGQMSSSFLMMAMVSIFWPDLIEWDSRSANFGKIKIGKTRFDLTGGLASYITLGSRLLAQSTKSSVTDTVTELNEGYGSQDGMDLFWDFIENKTSPMASVFKDVIKQETFEGDKPTILKEAQNLVMPILGETVYDAATIDSAAVGLLALIGEGIGMGVGTYEFNVNWENSTSKELIQFKEKVGDEEFEQANEEYNDLVNEKIEELKKDEKWLALDDEDKKKELTRAKADIKDKVFRNHKFRYRRK